MSSFDDKLKLKISLILEVIMVYLNIAVGIYICAKMTSHIKNDEITMLFFCYLLMTSMKSFWSLAILLRKEIIYPDIDKKKKEGYHSINDEISKYDRYAHIVEPILYYIYNYGISLPLSNITLSIYHSDLDEFKETDKLTFTAYYVIGIATLVMIFLFIFSMFCYDFSTEDRQKTYIRRIFFVSLLPYLFIIIIAFRYGFNHFELRFVLPIDFTNFDEIVFAIQFILTFIIGIIRICNCCNKN